jgi:hypothetical protein
VQQAPRRLAAAAAAAAAHLTWLGAFWPSLMSQCRDSSCTVLLLSLVTRIL